MIDRQSFLELAQRMHDYCVSIYIPTYRAGRPNEDQLRMKNALTEARDQLMELVGLDKEEAEEFLHRGYDLHADKRFWSRQSDGLAVFIGPDHFHYESIPYDVDPRVYVGKNYYLSPLLPQVSNDERFYLLALSQDEVRFFECGRAHITPIDISNVVPANKDEALMQETPDVQLHNHNQGSGRAETVYHGQSWGEVDNKREIQQYFHLIDRGITDILCDDTAPLLLAGVEYLIPIYKDTNQYKYLVEDAFIRGNVELDAPPTLHEKAWAIMEPRLGEQRRRDVELFGNNLARGEASFATNDVVPACINGRVAALFLRRGSQHFGHFEAQTNSIKTADERHLDNIDLLDYAAVQAFTTGARVHVVNGEDMPQPTSEIAAIYRYSY